MTTCLIRPALFFFLILFSACSSTSTSETTTTDETESRAVPALSVVSPVDDVTFAISSPFGPRLKSSDDNRYDFHRGIDIPGERGQGIYSVADGVLYAAYEEGSSAYPDGGNVVVVDYDLAEPFSFHDISVTQVSVTQVSVTQVSVTQVSVTQVSVTQVYGVYVHLDSFGVAAQAYLDSGEQALVSSGDVLGGMGDSGDTDFVHLHFEMRLGTTCSLAYQTENPETDCAQYGFDPHVNPFTFFTSESDPDDYTLSVASTSAEEIVFEVTATPEALGDSPLDVDGLRFEIFSDAARTDLVYESELGFDERLGFDATSTAALDNSDVDGFVVEPASFNTSSESYVMTFRAELPSDLDAATTYYYAATLFTTRGEVVEIDF